MTTRYSSGSWLTAALIRARSSRATDSASGAALASGTPLASSTATVRRSSRPSPSCPPRPAPSFRPAPPPARAAVLSCPPPAKTRRHLGNRSSAARAFVGTLKSLSRDVLPCSRRTSAARRPSAVAKSVCAARFAAPASGGAATRRTRRPARSASTRSLLERGMTRTATVMRSVTALDRRREDAKQHARCDLDKKQRDERREVDPAEERHRAPDGAEDRFAHSENELAKAERQAGGR